MPGARMPQQHSPSVTRRAETDAHSTNRGLCLHLSPLPSESQRARLTLGSVNSRTHGPPSLRTPDSLPARYPFFLVSKPPLNPPLSHHYMSRALSRSSLCLLCLSPTLSLDALETVHPEPAPRLRSSGFDSAERRRSRWPLPCL